MTAVTRATLKAFQNAGYKDASGSMEDLIDSAVNKVDDAATSGAAGIVELATDAEAISGAATDRAVTPANLAAAVTTHVATASTTVAGKVELATAAETAAGTDATRAVTPSDLVSGKTVSAGTLEPALVQHYQIAPAAVSATGVHAAIALTDAPQTVSTAITNPDVPRTVTAKGNAAGMTGNVVIAGTNIEGTAITDTIALNGTSEVEGVKAFKTVTTITVPAQTHDPDAYQQETSTQVATITTSGNAHVVVTAAGMSNSPKTIHVAVSQGVKQQETASVSGTITTSGNAKVTVRAAGMNNSPKDVSVAVLQGVEQVETATAAGTITTSGNGKATVTGAGINGGVPKDISFAVSQGVKQQETGTVVGTVTTDGNAKVVVTANGMTNSPKTVTFAVQSGVAQQETATVVAGADITGAGFMKCVLTADGMTGSPITTKEWVSVGDTAAECAAAMRGRLGLDSRITDFFTIGGAGADILLTAKTKAANDNTMNLTVENDTCTGITDDTSSADTTAGVAPDNASAVGGKARTALGLDGDVSAFFDITGSGANIVLTRKAEAADDGTMNIEIDNDTCAGLTPQPTSTNTRAGVAADGASAIAAAARTAIGLDAAVTALYAVGGSGADITLTRLTRAANDGTLNIALADDTCVGITPAPNSADTLAGVLQDDASGVAGKARTALGLDADVSAYFDISGSNENIILTRKAEASDDATMNIAIDNDTCAGLTAKPTSANTRAGEAPDDGAAVAGKMRTALGLDADVSAFFTVSGSGADVVLTAKTAAPNDTTMNIATDNDTCAGLTTNANSTNTTAGAYDTVSVGKASKYGLPHIVDYTACLLLKLFGGSTDAGSLAVDSDEVEKNLYSLAGSADGSTKLDLYYIA